VPEGIRQLRVASGRYRSRFRIPPAPFEYHMTNRMPAIFFGHGNPLNALLRNQYTEAWSNIGNSLPRPKAVLCASAHWYLPGTTVTAMAQPRTIHDFGGFPRELYEVKYPAPGSPEMARRVRDLLAPISVELDEESWGLDHGTWSVLCHVFPKADIPAVQLSIDETQPPEFHYELGKRLAPLRDEGVLIVGSGNLVHNLHTYAWGRHNVEPFDWAVRFEKLARELLLKGDDAPLVDYESLGRDALLSAPTPDHYLPLLYVIGSRKTGDEISFPVEGFDGGSISMLTVQIG
jgi:4,5-DOPA dioxygenase extradiol